MPNMIYIAFITTENNLLVALCVPFISQISILPPWWFFIIS